jgi:hypothetical protein
MNKILHGCLETMQCMSDEALSAAGHLEMMSAAAKAAAAEACRSCKGALAALAELGPAVLKAVKKVEKPMGGGQASSSSSSSSSSAQPGRAGDRDTEHLADAVMRSFGDLIVQYNFYGE